MVGDDVHNPFGVVKKKIRGPGIFDPGHVGDGEDPFEDDGHDDWEPEDDKSTREVESE